MAFGTGCSWKQPRLPRHDAEAFCKDRMSDTQKAYDAEAFSVLAYAILGC